MYEPRHEKTSVFFANVQAKAQLSCAVTVLPTSDCKADQRFCFRHIDSTISLLAKSEISSLELSSVGGGGGGGGGICHFNVFFPWTLYVYGLLCLACFH